MKYPTLYKMIQEIGFYNNMMFMPYNNIYWTPDIDWNGHEEDAKILSDEELLDFCIGDGIEMLKEKYNLHELHTVLDDIFEGYLREYFYY